ncbi:MAG: hypothetical protein HWD61_13580 [Parachlamydiaceae bacterium]|nr:MAG: hypothetical protein HWD61_13580 [Parachlamydiaceae bacterium]
MGRTNQKNGYEIDSKIANPSILSSNIHNSEFVQKALNSISIKKRPEREQAEEKFEEESQEHFQDSTSSGQKEEEFKDLSEVSQSRPEESFQEPPKEVSKRFQIDAYEVRDTSLAENAQEILESIVTLNFTPKTYDTKRFVEEVSKEFEALTKKFLDRLEIKIVTGNPRGSQGYADCIEKGFHFFIDRYSTGWGPKKKIFWVLAKNSCKIGPRKHRHKK